LITLLHVSGSVLTISLPAVGTLLVRIRFVFSGLLALSLILGARPLPSLIGSLVLSLRRGWALSFVGASLELPTTATLKLRIFPASST
jgi:hypothetical protein